MPAKNGTTSRAASEASNPKRPRKTIVIPEFVNESQEADWWASPAGRAFLKQKTATTTATKPPPPSPKGSRLVARWNKAASVQIALRLPEPDLAKAREIAERKGIGYQTLLKMLVHEDLQRGSRRS